MWLLLAVCLGVDGPLFWNVLRPLRYGPDDVGQLYVQEHLTRNWILFAGFVVLQGVLVVAVLRMHPPLQTSPLQLQAEKQRDSENAAGP
jgi:hypothetical protein